MANKCLKPCPRLLRFGIAGSVIAAVCCFTPILVIVFGAVELGWLTGNLDRVLLPALAVFLGLTAYALWQNGHAAWNERTVYEQRTVL